MSDLFQIQQTVAANVRRFQQLYWKGTTKNTLKYYTKIDKTAECKSWPEIIRNSMLSEKKQNNQIWRSFFKIWNCKSKPQTLRATYSREFTFRKKNHQVCLRRYKLSILAKNGKRAINKQSLEIRLPPWILMIQESEMLMVRLEKIMTARQSNRPRWIPWRGLSPWPHLR